MKTKFSACALVTAFVLLLGCASNKVNWDSRVGTYTYDQAVAELGPPDKATEISNGNKVAEWILDRSSRGSVGFGVGSGGYGRGVSTGVGVGTSIGPDRIRYLSLTFSPAGTLTEWKRGER